MPMTGARNQCHHRLFPASYIDGVSQPPARPDIAKIFNVVQSQAASGAIPDGFPSMFGVMFFQFMIHDMFATAISALDDAGKDCCSSCNRHQPQCSMAIDTSEIIGYANVSARCMSFIRAARCPCSDSETRQSMNMQTAYLDLSHLYNDGADRDPVAPWRLASTPTSRSGRVPSLAIHPPACYSHFCFDGDKRINQQQGISSHHVIWENLHNSIADSLRIINRNWTDDKVFEEARKITIARFQCLISNNVNNILIDDDILRAYGIHFDQLRQGTQYDPNILAVAYTESAHAEERAHRLVADVIGNWKWVWLDSSNYFDLEFDFITETIQGQWGTPAHSAYRFQSAMAQEVLKKIDMRVGQSMILLNVQRGRDVGLPNYKTVLEWTYNATIQSYADIAGLNIYGEHELNVLRKLYPRVDDIDMFIGGHFDRPYKGKVLPLTFQHIRAIQHKGHVYGDRFHFSHVGMFTKEQLAVILNTTPAKILCEALNITKVPLNPFVYDAEPKMVDCDQLKVFNIDPWKELQE